MNTRLLVHVLGLRYRLLWAQSRFRNGKIALFLAGYLLAAVVAALLAFGGFGAALVSIRAGKAELVARVVLTSFYVNALMTAITLGVGMNPVFSDAALRRFPLTNLERLAARQATGFLEPLWLFLITLNSGLAAGFSVMGVSPFWLAFPAGLLVAFTCYLLARVLLSIVERIAAMRYGSALLLVVVVSISVLPGLLAPTLVHSRAFRSVALAILKYTPSFAGAAAMSGGPMAQSLMWLMFIVLWCAVLVFALALVERIPIPSATVARARASWGGRIDRIAAWFGPEWGPLVGKSLRYYFRSNRVRMNILFAVPTMCAIVVMNRGSHPGEVFLSAVGVIAVVGFIATANMAVNAFGYDGAGFRRYLTAPMPPERALHATSLTAVLIGAAQIPVALLVWGVLGPSPTSAAMWTMLVSSAVCGLFLFQGLAVWTTLLAPRRTAFAHTFGNDLSFAANVLVVGGILLAVFLPHLVIRFVSAKAILAWWLAGPPLACAAFAFYWMSLRLGATVFRGRRERLLAAVEGRG